MQQYEKMKTMMMDGEAVTTEMNNDGVKFPEIDNVLERYQLFFGVTGVG